jgi:hypothetical protein
LQQIPEELSIHEGEEENDGENNGHHSEDTNLESRGTPRDNQPEDSF